MRTEGLVYAADALFEAIRHDAALGQVCNVATLPGIVGPSMAMPDIHWGYGFPIGGVAAFDEDEGVVSPGGVGFDISCGVRLLRSALSVEELRRDPPLRRLADVLFEKVPSGVGIGARRHLKPRELEKVMTQGAGWAVAQGFGQPADLQYLEEQGCISGADPAEVSERAVERGARQLGTLGSGNHFLELQEVDRIYDAEAARVLGLAEGSVAVSIHTGSRGFGYQICEDHLRGMVKASARYGIDLPDRQLCCAPLASREGRAYLAAMACGANFALANRQVITQSGDRSGIGSAWSTTYVTTWPSSRRTRSRDVAAVSAYIAKGPPARCRRVTPSFRRPTVRSGSPCSSRATWAATPTSCAGMPAPHKRPTHRAVTVLVVSSPAKRPKRSPGAETR
jgi:tRNA-splicing ligase RtcB